MGRPILYFPKKKIPRYIKKNLEELELNPDEWWYIPDNSALAKRISIYYPFFDPIVDNKGNLIGMTPWEKWKIYGEPEPEKPSELPKDDKPKVTRHKRHLRYKR